MLGHLLHQAGIDSVILERHTEDYVVERVRAGVLEQGTVDLMREAGVGGRLAREGLRHEGVWVAVHGRRHRIDLAGLTGGRAVTVYGQHEVVKDLIAARRASGRPLHFEAAAVSLSGLESDRPAISYEVAGTRDELRCDIVAGCDGFHGVSRQAVPPSCVAVYEAPSSDELVYSLSDRGFALFSMRSPTVTRLYLQCAPDEDLAAWSDDRIWHELRTRLGTDDGWRPNEGPITQKGVTGMRSVVTEPMRHGRLFLAGDAAHIVPPTGAKGLNLAMADVWRLARAIAAFSHASREELLDRYSPDCLQRVWRAQRFSWWMTSMLHQDAAASAFDRRRQLAELDYLFSSRAAMTSLAENYVGAPFD
jgi:p-hydroxybenzoate 3-monooxygenase